MKIYTTQKRVPGINKNFGFETYKTATDSASVADVEEFLAIHSPIKNSPNLLTAIVRAFDENGSVVFNAGSGNQKFYFKDAQ